MGAYTRLIDHITAALEAVTTRWERSLSSVLSSMGDPKALAVELVGLRRKLARRLELARHASLPQVLRDAFSDAADRNIRQYQQQLEDAVKSLGRSGRAPTSLVDELHYTVKANSFVAVLGYTADVPGGRFTADHRPADPAGHVSSTPERPRGRRIIL